MNIIQKQIDDLIPYVNNPRKNDEAVEKVALSISAFGFKVPIVIDKENVIVAGHTRHLAAKKLGLKEVPCIVADDLSPEQIKAFRLADNKVSEFSEWDFEKLEKELEELDFDMSLYGFDELEKEIDDLNEVEEDEVPELPEEPTTKPGQMFKLGKHRLLCGDSTIFKNIENLMGGGQGRPCLY